MLSKDIVFWLLVSGTMDHFLRCVISVRHQVNFLSCKEIEPSVALAMIDSDGWIGLRSCGLLGDGGMRACFGFLSCACNK